MTELCKHCGGKPTIESQRENVWVAYCTSLDCPDPPFCTGTSIKSVTEKWDVVNRVQEDPRKAQALEWLKLNRQLAEWADANTDQLSMLDWLIEEVSR